MLRHRSISTQTGLQDLTCHLDRATEKETACHHAFHGVCSSITNTFFPLENIHYTNMNKVKQFTLLTLLHYFNFVIYVYFGN